MATTWKSAIAVSSAPVYIPKITVAADHTVVAQARKPKTVLAAGVHFVVQRNDSKV